MTTRRDALQCATELVRGLIAHGVQGFVISPGSRNTPLSLAAAREAADTFVILDERSAGFFALGRARALRAPVAALCTSGTAAANFLPAVVEASQSRVPLIVLTADRPPELHGVGANQTIPQHDLFGDFVRRGMTLPVATSETVAIWRDAAAEAVRATQSPAGPVHLNLQFREPFIPKVGEAASNGSVASGTRLSGSPADEPDPQAILKAADLVDSAESILLFAGGLDYEIDPLQLAEEAKRIGGTFVAEPTSGCRSQALGVAGFTLESVAAERLRPDLVIQLGRAPTSRKVARFISKAKKLVTVDPDGWIHDPDGKAESHVRSGLLEFLKLMPVREADSSVNMWEEVDASLQFTLDDLFLAAPDLWEGSALREMTKIMRPEEDLVVGNSLPIRDLDVYGRPKGRVIANRGASGIDGLVSTFAGVASTKRPVTGVIGDLSALHDASGLVWLSGQTQGTLVILDNGGGGIFDLLESAKLPEHERLFRTPHEGRLDRLLAALEVQLIQPKSLLDLRECLAAPCEGTPLRVLHVLIDPARSVEARSRTVNALESAAASVLERF